MFLLVTHPAVCPPCRLVQPRCRWRVVRGSASAYKPPQPLGPSTQPTSCCHKEECM
ncbi:cystic fibrosis transmembrane conductance regulator [Anopheles sinensis]|uniref:Cystic fibrosis transmembrane conductance regulator n=1 Tax=Anopheles sinensis TaxID=74873 RepID=A0A084W7J4_ANOSI|nr:cystic fibrosis transmembrane conductance regulator [Anopheles sinensis]